MQMTPPLSMIPATSHFQVPMPQMTGAYQQAMFGGQFHGHFPASPQFVSQGYSGGNDQGQQQPSQALEVERMKNDTQIMFTDATKLASGLREWVLKRQMEIMIRDGVHSNAGDSGNNDSRG